MKSERKKINKGSLVYYKKETIELTKRDINLNMACKGGYSKIETDDVLLILRDTYTYTQPDDRGIDTATPCLHFKTNSIVALFGSEVEEIK